MDGNDKLRTIVSTILGIPPEQVTDDLSSETAETWDSLNHINLIGALEQEFGVTLATNNLAESQSIREIKKLLSANGVPL